MVIIKSITDSESRLKTNCHGITIYHKESTRSKF